MVPGSFVCFLGGRRRGPAILSINAGIHIGPDHPGIHMLTTKFADIDPIYLSRTASPTRVQQAQRAANTTRHLATPTTYPTRTTDWAKDPKPDTDPDA